MSSSSLVRSHFPTPPEQWSPQTVPAIFGRTTKKFGSQIAMRQILAIKGAPQDGPYDKKFKEISFTWSKYNQEASGFAKALIAHGLQPQGAVTIQGSNSTQWLFAYMGTLLAGGISVGVYPTNGPELSQHSVENSDANVVVVEDDAQLQKYAGLKKTGIKCFVVWNKIMRPEITKQLPAPVYSWNEFISHGKKVPDSVLNDRLTNQKPNQICSLIYTSGTTGLPKAAALTHDNLTWTATVTGTEFKLHQKHHGISYLPLSHIAAQMVDVIIPVVTGQSVTIAPPDALKGANLKQHLVHASPTYFLAVPRVWEKFMEGIQESSRKLTGYKKKMGEARQWLLKDIRSITAKNSSGFFASMYKVRKAADQFFLNIINQKILKAIGLQKCTIAASGAGALDPKAKDFLKDLGIDAADLYGLSETSGPATLQGRTIPGTRITIANQDPEGKGEIRLKGRHIFKGYWKNDEATKSAFDSEGFFCTGDEGKLDGRGNLVITGRLKELIKTSGGENIPPVRIEQRIKEALPVIDQAVVIGDRRNYLTCLLTLQTELDMNGNPTDKLAPIVQDQLIKLGSKATTINEAQADSLLIDFLMKGIKKANFLVDSQAQCVQKITILPEGLSVANGLMTPTQKLKRRVIEERFSGEIEAMYRN